MGKLGAHFHRVEGAAGRPAVVAAVDVNVPALGTSGGTVTAKVRRVFEKKFDLPWTYAMFFVDDLEFQPTYSLTISPVSRFFDSTIPEACSELSARHSFTWAPPRPAPSASIPAIASTSPTSPMATTASPG